MLFVLFLFCFVLFFTLKTEDNNKQFALKFHVYNRFKRLKS